MTVIEIKDENDFNDKLNQAGDKLVVVDFYAEWCPPCVNLAPFIEGLSVKYSQVLFLRVDVDALEEFVETFNLTAYPTLIFLKNSKEVKRLIGADKSNIENSIEQFSIDEDFKIVKRSLSQSAFNSVSENVKPLKADESGLITINGETGVWVNKDEDLNWKSAIPISAYRINEDDEPEVIIKENDEEIEYDEEVIIRYLKPPTPPPPGEILVLQESETQSQPSPPPLIIRQQAERVRTPSPLIIRETPPERPVALGQKIITIPSIKTTEPPVRKVIIEKLAAPPPKPRQVIIEKWLPYPKQKRKVIFQESNKTEFARSLSEKPKNVIVQYEAPKIRTNKVYKELDVLKADPEDYKKTYGDSLKTNIEILKQIPSSKSLNLMDNQSRESSSLIELEGDVEALKLIDLENAGLTEYKDYLSSYVKPSNSIVETNVEIHKGDLFCLPKKVRVKNNVYNSLNSSEISVSLTVENTSIRQTNITEVTHTTSTFNSNSNSNVDVKTELVYPVMSNNETNNNNNKFDLNFLTSATKLICQINEEELISEIKNETEFYEKLNDAGKNLVVVEFYAEWCGPNQIFHSFVEDFYKKNKNVFFYKINYDSLLQFSRSYNITSFPTFIFFRNSQEVDRIVGTDLSNLEEIIKDNSLDILD